MTTNINSRNVIEFPCLHGEPQHTPDFLCLTLPARRVVCLRDQVDGPLVVAVHGEDVCFLIQEELDSLDVPALSSPVQRRLSLLVALSDTIRARVKQWFVHPRVPVH